MGTKDKALTPAPDTGQPLAEYGGWNRAQVDLIKTVIAKNATDDELKLFGTVCKRTGLDPFARQIYFQKYKDQDGNERMTIITGIDGYRSTAAKTQQHAGTDDVVYEGVVKVEKVDAPEKATVTVYRFVNGQRVAFTATARWKEYYPGEKKGFKWRQMPFLMLGKCAEALALRKAFPLELGGVYTPEEIEQIEREPEPEEIPAPRSVQSPRTTPEPAKPQNAAPAANTAAPQAGPAPITNVAAFKDRQTGVVRYSVLWKGREFLTENEKIALQAKDWKGKGTLIEEINAAQGDDGKFWIQAILPATAESAA